MFTYSIGKKENVRVQLDIIRSNIPLEECERVLESILNSNQSITKYYVYFMLGDIAQIRMPASEFLAEMRTAAQLLEEQ